MDVFISDHFELADLNLDGILDPIPALDHNFDSDTQSDEDSDDEEALLPPPGARLNAGVTHLVTQGTVTFPQLDSNGPYTGRREVFQEVPVTVTGILVRNTPKDNYLIVSIAHRYGDQADVFLLSAISAAQNITDGTYYMESSKFGHRATGRFTSGLAVNPEKTWIHHLDEGQGHVKISDFEISPSGAPRTSTVRS